MKKHSMLYLAVSLALSLFVTETEARPVAEVVRSARPPSSSPAHRAAAAGQARADTLFLFAAEGDGAFGAPGTDARGFTFDAPGMDCTPAGWFGVDNSEQTGLYWHIEDANRVDNTNTDISEALPFDPLDLSNDYAMHCGRWDVCGWQSPDGYGNGWDQYLRLISGDFADSLVIAFSFISDYEGDVWDWFEVLLEVEVDGSIDLAELYHNEVSHEGVYRDTTFTVLLADYPSAESFGDVILRFKSDGAWSDQDGLFITDVGAVWVDNIILTKDSVEIIREDFESGIANPAIVPDAVTGAGNTAALYPNLYTEDFCTINQTCSWAFFDLQTISSEYPDPIIPYGPPYLDAAMRSPLLTIAHSAGNPNGAPMSMGPDTRVNLDFWVYYDMPSDALIYYAWTLAAYTPEQGCVGVFANDNTVYYGDNKQWGVHNEDDEATLAVLESAMGGTVAGIQIELQCIDMCPYWCNTNGSGMVHSPAPFMDNVQLSLLNAWSVAWSASPVHHLQDNFPEASADGHGGAVGMVRMDPALSVEPLASPVVVIGDSTVVELSMDGHGGIGESFSPAAGENRPELWMYFQIVAGPHRDMLSAAMGDPDGGDGCFSPYEGMASDPVSGLPAWGVVRADLARYQGTPQPGQYAFDLADDYFEPGDVIHYFWSAIADDGYSENHPAWALSSNLDLRQPLLVRCLPTSGAEILLVDDGNSALPYWRDAFLYNGYGQIDIYTTQAPDAGFENGLAGRASAVDIVQYDGIIWDSGNESEHTIATIAGGDKTDDGQLLTDYLENGVRNTALWVMGDRIAGDLGASSPFLLGTLGAQLLDDYYDEPTGIIVPRVYATDPLLGYLGGEPTYWVDGGCPDIQHFDRIAVNPAASFASVTHDWEVSSANEVAGIKNLDPDGNGTILSDQGFVNHVLFQVYSYSHVYNDLYGLPAGVNYARKSVGDILERIFDIQHGYLPDAVPDTPLFTQFHGNYPNPFNPSTAFRFSLAEPGRVSLAIYDVSGRRVRKLIEGALPTGEHEIVWDGRDDRGGKSASGVYFSRFIAGDVFAERKLVMLK